MESTILTVILALCAILLGISVIVQTLQEIYKYVSNSKSRSYSNAMRSYMGSMFSQILQSSVVQDTRIAGPFQIFRYRPKNYTLPINKDQLEKSLYSTLSPWKKRTLDALKLESQIQNGTAATPSPEWQKFLNDLVRVPRNTPSAYSALDVMQFLEEWHHKGLIDAPLNEGVSFFSNFTLDAQKMLAAFNARFFSDQKYYLDNYSSFNQAFDFQYKRRNARHSFLIALLLTLFCNLPIQEVYQSAKGMKESDAIALADAATKNAAKESNNTSAVPEKDTANTTSEIEASKKIIEAIKSSNKTNPKLFNTGMAKDKLMQLVPFKGFPPASSETWAYVLGCFITTILVTFGAPILNDVAGTIVRMKRGDPAKEDDGGLNGDN